MQARGNRSMNKSKAHASPYNEHSMTVAQLREKFSTSINEERPETSQGLTRDQASRRLAEQGRNELTPPKQITMLERLFAILFKDAFMVMLEGASALGFIAFALTPDDPSNLVGPKKFCVFCPLYLFSSKTYCYFFRLFSVVKPLTMALVIPIPTYAVVFLQYMACALIAIIALTSGLTLFQEGQASDVMSGFQNMMPANTLALRDGARVRISAATLVTGDIVVLGTGDKIPADRSAPRPSPNRPSSWKLTTWCSAGRWLWKEPVSGSLSERVTVVWLGRSRPWHPRPRTRNRRWNWRSFASSS
uniref:Cation-transporting P-type ATPase N-terminal domain-containing protein n=1 Tax=Spongospora subterranea TaxID=70186 RepID=A0A0H5QGP5_9EUKA|eukprot:CRZ00476.1 hypothetical protein [Spongospora subterranea]